MKKILFFLILFLFTTACSKINVFGFGKEKSDFEKLKINEALWTASTNLLSNYSNVEKNLKEGLISTDWIITKKSPNSRFRISIYILGSSFIEENLIVFCEKEFNKKGVWTKTKVSEAFIASIKLKKMEDANNYDKI